MKYAIIGLARTGRSVFRFLQEKGFDTIGIDTSLDQPRQKEILSCLEGDLLLGNDFHTATLTDRVCVVSPGIPESSKIYQKILKEKAQIVSDLDIFDIYNISEFTIGITGTNGKTTTTDMLCHILSKNQISCQAGANFGVGALDLLQQKVLVNVLELSSFQLKLTHKLRLSASSILNISSNHLDRHSSFEDYVASKRKIFDFSEQIVANSSLPETHPPDYHSRCIFTGIDNASGLGITQEKTNFIITDSGKRLSSSKEIGISELHDIQNLLVAMSFARIVGVSYEQSLSAISSFQKRPHRLERLKERYINDSKSTTTTSTIAGIQSIAGRIVLMLGGDNKNADISDLSHHLPHISRVICFGKDAKKFHDLASIHTSSTIEQDIETAIRLAIDITKSLDATLLFSPAGTSLDRFKSYEERGDFFKRLVNEYA